MTDKHTQDLAKQGNAEKDPARQKGSSRNDVDDDTEDGGRPDGDAADVRDQGLLESLGKAISAPLLEADPAAAKGAAAPARSPR